MKWARISTDSSIRTLKKGWFKVEIDVKYLTLEALYVIGIEENAFNAKQFVNLHVLKFRRMHIVPISNGIFNGLHNLRILHFEHSYLGGFLNLALKQVPNLSMFAIYDCRFHMWFDSLFESVNMMHLHHIFIEKCTMKDAITNKTFAGLPNIKQLYLNHNHIKEINDGSFDKNFKKLKVLDLSSNELTTLPENLFETKQIHMLHVKLTDNPWYCDNTLLNVLTPSANVEFDEILCLNPLEYRGCSLNSLISRNNETITDGQTRNSANQRFWFTPNTCEPIIENLQEGIEFSGNEKEIPTDIAVEFKTYQLENEDENESGEESEIESGVESENESAGESENESAKESENEIGGETGKKDEEGKKIESATVGKKGRKVKNASKKETKVATPIKVESDDVVETARIFESTVVEGNLEAKPGMNNDKMTELTDNEGKKSGKIIQNENKHDDKKTGKNEKSVDEGKKGAEITSKPAEPIEIVLPTETTPSEITPIEYINSPNGTNLHSGKNSDVKLSSGFVFLFFSFMCIFH